jgi:hypothetical protein
VKHELAPDIYRNFGNYWLWWFSANNQYVCVEEHWHKALQLLPKQLTNGHYHTSKAQLKLTDEADMYTPEVLLNLHEFLADLHTPVNTNEVALSATLKTDKCTRVTHYQLGNKSISLHTDRQNHAGSFCFEMAAYEVAAPEVPNTNFWLYEENNHLYLFKDKDLLTAVATTDVHLIQGKLKMHVLCVLYHNEEKNWIGTLKATTVELNRSATLLVGPSGSGKTTLAALLAAHGFSVVADDITGLRAKDHKVCTHPGALSLRLDTRELLAEYYPNLDASLQISRHTYNKGEWLYLNAPVARIAGFVARSMVMVNYVPGAKTKLEPMSIKELVALLIPNSWLIPHKLRARDFMDWLLTLKLYKLTYSKTTDAINAITLMHN